MVDRSGDAAEASPNNRRATVSGSLSLNFNFPGLSGLFGGGAGAGGGDVQKFIGTLGSSGLTRKSRYEMQVITPKKLSGLPRDLAIRCEAITFPGQNIKSVPDTLRFGPEREHAQGFTYGSISATFISDRLQKEKGFFERWQYNVMDYNTWEPKYYNDYTGGLKIWHLDQNNKKGYGVELFEVYPKLINAQDVGHAQGNSYQTVTIEFTYHHWFPATAGAANGGASRGTMTTAMNAANKFRSAAGIGPGPGSGITAAVAAARGLKINTGFYDSTHGFKARRYAHPNIENYITREGRQDADAEE